MSSTKPFVLCAVVAAVCSSAPPVIAAGDSARITPIPADMVFTGGSVLTMNEEQPRAQAVAIRDGTIVFVGTNEAAQTYRGEGTQAVDLTGRVLLPGFIDTHSHLSIAAQVYDYLDLRPAPFGPVKNIADLKRVLRDGSEQSAAQNEGWIVSYGYDHSLLEERRHPTRFDLDEVSSDHPIVLVHASMHVFVGNSEALKRAGIDASTEDPTGGRFQRVGKSREPNGVIEELAAANRLLRVVPQPSVEKLVENLSKVQRDYAREGVTTAQEGAATLREMALLDSASRGGQLILDTVVLPYWHSIDAVLARGGLTVGRYHGRLKIGGIKLGLDGSMSAKTAYMLDPYSRPPSEHGKNYRGYLQITKETIFEQFERIYRDNWQINAHVSGDAAAKIMVDAVASAQKKYGKRDHRAVMLHAISVRERDMDRMQELGILPSFYSYHVCTWGDWHNEGLGSKRASTLAPAGWAEERGMRFTVHSDAPISPVSPLGLIACNVKRKTIAGQTIGSDQRLTVMAALKAMTIHAAYQYFEENQKGSIEVGKLADLVVLSANPLTTALESIGGIEVLSTYKDGKAIYHRE